MKRVIVLSVLLIAMSLISTVYAGGPPEANIRNAYKMILSQADANKDGKLSSAECMAIYKDKNLAKKNCTFWDIDQDGVITEDEYVKKASNIGNKKKR
jgi:hypothetical protein